jgi:hypothetical protein
MRRGLKLQGIGAANQSDVAVGRSSPMRRIKNSAVFFMAHRSPGGGCSEPEAGPEAIAEKTPLSALVNRQNDLRGYSNGTPRSGRAYDTTQTNAWLNNVQNGFRDLARFLDLCE